MARIAGVDLPRDKRLEIGLTYIYGIGLTRAQKVCSDTGVDPDTYGIPIVSSSVDFVGAFTLVWAIALLGLA